jgi:ketosteroid isomerase-like protein
MEQRDQYAISVAKTEYREAYKTCDVDRLLAVFAPGFVDCSDGSPSFYGEEARRALELRSKALFGRYKVDMFVIIIDIAVQQDTAFDRGWHKVRLTDKATGEVTDTMYRYFEKWQKDGGQWKISYIMTNREHPPQMLPEDKSVPADAASDA